MLSETDRPDEPFKTVISTPTTVAGGQYRVLTEDAQIKVYRSEPGIFWLDASGLLPLFRSYREWAHQIRVQLKNAGFESVVAVGNGRQAGGGFQVTADAVLDDGLLDVMGIVDVEVSQLGTIFGELANMKAPENKYVHYAKLPAFRIESDNRLGAYVVEAELVAQVNREYRSGVF